MIVEQRESGLSLNLFLKKRLQLSAKKIKALLDQGAISYKGKVERFGSIQLSQGDRVFVAANEEMGGLIFEDDDFIIYNKPSRLSCEDLAKKLKLILIHRLDKETSGLIILGKRHEVKEAFEHLFKERVIEKVYTALVHGRMRDEKGVIDDRIGVAGIVGGMKKMKLTQGGMEALTEWSLITTYPKYSLLHCRPRTGRTHQLRVHLKGIGHPIVGDRCYGESRSPFPRFMLHASKLQFKHPITGKPMDVTSKLPGDFWLP